MALGASRFLIKPMELDDVFKMVQAVIKEHQARNLIVPAEPLPAMEKLDRMQLEVLAGKLDKKVRQLEQAREVSRKRENKYRKLLESVMDGFVYVDMDGMIRESNETYRNLLGYDDEELKRLFTPAPGPKDGADRKVGRGGCP
jgi:PAS domain-containing protein